MEFNLSQDQVIRYAKIAGVVLAVILILLLLSKGVKFIKDLFSFGGDNRDENPQFDPNEYLEGLPISNDFSLESYVAELHDAVTATLFFNQSTRCKAYKRYTNDLNDNEFIAVANAYYGEYSRTLRSDINKTFVNGCSVFSTNWEEAVIERMNKLGIV